MSDKKSLPRGWTYDHIRSSRDPRDHGAQVHAARCFVDHLGAEVCAQAQTLEGLVERAETLDLVIRSTQALSPDVIVVPRRELQRLLDDNAHSAGQVKELQGALTLKEEQLRAHRRVPLQPEQKTALLADLEATTRRVREGYNLPTAIGLSDRLRRDLEEKTRPILDDCEVK